jgi:hypothetical protein
LADSKRQGRTFDVAWWRALRDCPPRGRDLTLSVEHDQGELFDSQGRPPEQDETVVEAMERYCRDAYLGQKPGLRSFTLDMLREDDQSRPASPHGRLNAAA